MLDFVRKLIELYNEYGELGKDLLPIIQQYIRDLNSRGMSTKEIIGDTGVRADRLIAKLEGE